MTYAGALARGALARSTAAARARTCPYHKTVSCVTNPGRDYDRTVRSLSEMKEDISVDNMQIHATPQIPNTQHTHDDSEDKS